MKFPNVKISRREFVPPIIFRIARRVQRTIYPCGDKPPSLFTVAQPTNHLNGYDPDPGYYDKPMERFIHEALGSYSGVEHEDLLIDLLLSFKKTGFYVDVGANDPSFPGNTQRFYLRGWSGINIEPQLEPYKKLVEARPRDINLNFGVALERGKMTFYQSSASDTSSLNKKMALKSSKWHRAELSTIEIEVMPLRDVFSEHLKRKEIDFMSVDVEGCELNVLKSNDWEKYRPMVLIIEIVHYDRREIIEYLNERNYLLVYNNLVNGIFVDHSVEIHFPS